MNFTQAVRSRRAVKNYQSTPVAPALIEEIIELAVQAPSAMNLQPWAFMVIEDAAGIDSYAELAKQYFLSQRAVPTPLRAMLEDAAYSIFHHAPVLVLVLARTDSEQAREDCCLAAQNLMLAARDAGLGTCWIGLGRPWLNLPATRQMLKLPAGYRVVAPIVMGYPVEWPEPHARAAPEIHWMT